MTIDVEALKARTDIVAIVAGYVPELKKVGNVWKACCPFHHESTASFTVHPAPDSYYKCFGCSSGGDVISFVENIAHTDFKGAIEILGGTNGNGTNGNGHKPEPITPEWVPKEKPQDYNAPAPADAPACQFVHSGMPKPNIAWAYYDKNGAILGWDARYDSPDGSKKVIPWRWIDGAWRMKGFAAPTPLYGLDLIEKFKDLPVMIVEGCKAAEAARKMFKGACIVVSWQGGVDSVKKVDLSPLHGRSILLWPDADSEAKKLVGQAAMRYFANKLMYVCPSVIYYDPNPTAPCSCMGEEEDCERCEGRGRVNLTEPMPDGWDAADALEEGWNWQKWLEWANARKKLISPQAAETAIEKAVEDRKAVEKKLKEAAVKSGVLMPYQSKWVDWGMYIQGESGIPYASLDNVCRILEHDPNLQNFVYYDTFLQKTFNCHSKREWADEDEVNLMLYIQRSIGLQKVSRNTVAEAIIATAYKDTRNCVKEWLETLVWDGEERLEDFFPQYFGCGRTPYTAAVGRCFLVSLVARAYLPGCKADHMIVLEGPQGIRKSSALEALVGSEWYADTSESVASKDFLQLIQGKILIELGEMGALDKADRETVKQMLSRRSDRFRGSYARYSVDRPRQCIFAGTTNKDNWNKDETGARRFWPIRCRVIDLAGLIAIREQLFAEAVARFKRVPLTASEMERVEAGADWWITPGEETKREQEARYDDDPWTAPITEAIRSRFEITIFELMTDVLKIDPQRMGPAEQRRIGAILRHAGWSKSTEREKDGSIKTNRVWRPRIDEYEL